MGTLSSPHCEAMITHNDGISKSTECLLKASLQSTPLLCGTACQSWQHMVGLCQLTKIHRYPNSFLILTLYVIYMLQIAPSWVLPVLAAKSTKTNHHSWEANKISRLL